tara:strand:- start:25 stop:453 length:429 start_codon:yes stop_codon:yes gene_type:complete
MSEIKTNKLTGTSTAGSILVTAEGNSTTTNLQQGLAKSWGSIDQDSTDHPIYDSFNLSSTSDEGTGYTICSYSNAMDNVNYGITVAGQAQDESGGGANVYGKSTTVAARTTATGSFCFDNRNPSGGQLDLKYCAYAIHGDLA